MVFSVIGWTIIHSLWQCLGLLAVLKLFLGLTDVRRSGLRYAAALGVLGVAIIGVLATFVWEWRTFAVPTIAGGGIAAPLTGSAGGVFINGGAGGFSLLSWLSRACPSITLVWGLGVVFYAGRMVLGGIELRRMRRLPGIADARVSALLEDLRERMGVTRVVRLLITDRASEPMTFGFLRAVVVLPLSYIGQMPADQLEMVLAHEMAHIGRRDYLVNLVQHVFDALLFFNPFFQMLSTAVREEREFCCDDRAALVGGDQRRMAVALTNLGLARKGLALGLSVAPERRSFYRRVTRLIEPQKRSLPSVRFTLFGALAAFVLVVVLSQCTRGVVAQGNLPAEGDRVTEVLSDNQAGYKEVVYNYQKAGQSHDLFMVKTTDGKNALYAYMDGARLDSEQLASVVHVLKVRRPTEVIYVRPTNTRQNSGEEKLGVVVSDGVEKQVKSNQAERGDTVEVVKVGSSQISEDVNSAMSEYKKEMKRLPLEVEQHDLLTRIVVNNIYTAADRQQLNGLIQKKAQLQDQVEITGKP